MRAVLTWFGPLLGIALMCSCSFSKSDHPDACRLARDCARGQACYQGFCVQRGGQSKVVDAGGGGSVASDAGNGRDGAAPASDAGSKDSGQTGAKCSDGQPPEACYDGAKGTMDVGICKGGQRACVGGAYTQCLGQVLPGDETCNGKDDNCDGQIDEIPMGDCQTQMPGLCNTGQLTCRGTYAVCEPVTPPVQEICNAKDDDCDGMTDEVDSKACYPAATVGCTVAADGSAKCVGLCSAGQSACSGGKTGCSNAVTPVDEICTTGNSTAADEDCDSNVDEGCACTTGQTRPCYAGPDGTEGQGACRAGTQQCVSSLWGGCNGQILPQPETCANSGVDDDCNGTKDDVPGLGNACIDNTKLGICRDGTMQCGNAAAPSCVTASAMHELCDTIDQDCDGDPTNGFDLTSDHNNCGRCGNVCNKAETCCGGSCIGIAMLQSDPKNCGKCGNACGAGQYCCQAQCINGPSGGIRLPPSGGITALCQCTSDCGSQSCCGTQCVDMLNDVRNCGGCGNDCTNGGVLLKVSCCNGTCSTTGLCLATQ
jgi:hypothetical protein